MIDFCGRKQIKRLRVEREALQGKLNVVRADLSITNMRLDQIENSWKAKHDGAFRFKDA